MAKKRMGWLSEILNNPRTELDQDPNKLDDHITELDFSSNDQITQGDLTEVTEQLNTETTARDILSINKDEDKITFDLVVAVKNIVNDRLLTDNRLANVEVQLSEEIEKNIKLKSAIKKKERESYESQELIKALEEKLVAKQMTYDQLLNDYKNYQENAKAEIDNVKFLYQKEQEKYIKLTMESRNNQNESLQKIDRLEEKIRDLEAENKKINENYQSSLTDKNMLLQTINEFTNRFTVNTGTVVSNNERFNGDSEAPQIK